MLLNYPPMRDLGLAHAGLSLGKGGGGDGRPRAARRTRARVAPVTSMIRLVDERPSDANRDL